MRDSVHVVVCKKKAVQWQEETLALSGTQRHLGGPLCTNKQQKLHVLWFAQAKLPDSLLWLHISINQSIFECIMPHGTRAQAGPKQHYTQTTHIFTKKKQLLI